MSKLRQWENEAIRYYTGTEWERKAIAAGKAMDNRMDFIAKGPYGSIAESSFFDVAQWLAWFDWEVLKRRNLIYKK
jgi:hypothetical protein